MAKVIEMLFWSWALMGDNKSCIRWGPRCPDRKGQFWRGKSDPWQA